MIINDDIIKKLEKLSSIKVDEEKKDVLKHELEEIVNFVDNLNDINVSDVEATFTNITQGTPFRKDEATNNEEVSKHILKHAPHSEDGYFIVPKVIE